MEAGTTLGDMAVLDQAGQRKTQGETERISMDFGLRFWRFWRFWDHKLLDLLVLMKRGFSLEKNSSSPVLDAQLNQVPHYVETAYAETHVWVRALHKKCLGDKRVLKQFFSHGARFACCIRESAETKRARLGFGGCCEDHSLPSQRKRDVCSAR